MSTEVVRLALHHDVAIITLNRPRVHNVVDEAVMEALESALDRLDADRNVRVLVLTGAGEETFCAGGDLRWFATFRTRREVAAMSGRMVKILGRLSNGRRTVVAAVNGQAYGGGGEILTWCHVRIAAAHARFSFRHAVNGITAGWGGGLRLMEILGRDAALRLFLGAETIDAAEAHRLGFVHHVVPVDHLQTAAFECARGMAANSAFSLRGFMELARLSAGDDPAAARRREAALFVEGWMGGDFQRVLGRYRETGAGGGRKPGGPRR
jgi:enoyl-CoA hydratase